ncbi:pyridoxamine 5'-phosphate oxidase family protein [Cellulophaga sp. BC115SP]|uniref:pyridoxamine 5'-phosphate oxidase family protein n=1 Tax=Cellulophaga sp. BC115SP TaxID=2683263 RepID=UPI001412539F|nr:pyridoxamine 5'-phosphate oxidase family protein [Cellulophaga sp. BC115SP]NBB28523.1 pyridoxamine 5'-phosphate oxidase family protein [Cellulophaga sp. BC115SP]
MGTFSNTITSAHKKFVDKQHMFFVSTAPLNSEGHVNLSPKGLDCFRFLSDTKVGYMDLISSGNETSAHILENGRITLMFCSFKGPPSILRLYGKAITVLPETELWDKYAPHFTIHPSTRQLIVADISLVQTSCGWGVPLYDYVGERDTHFKWADKLGQEGLQEYVKENNLVSLDGLPTSLGLK